ncbi:MAG: hypothetical protein AAGH57_12960 [Pseudomonadota bacterium]
MLKPIWKYVVFFVAVFTVPVDAQPAKDQEDIETYLNLSEELNSLPIPLLSDSGDAHFLVRVALGSLALLEGAIVNEDGAPEPLPGHAIMKPIAGQGGYYLIEHAQDGQAVARLAHLQSDKLVLANALPNPFRPGSLTSLPDGTIASFDGGKGGDVTIHFGAFRIGSGELTSGTDSVKREISGNYVWLGNIAHPQTRVWGQALLGDRHVVLVYPSGDDVRIEIEPGLRVFAAGKSELVLGFFNPECPASEGLPPGMCTPYLFKAELPEEDTTFSVGAVAQYPMLSASRPGWTFGAHDPADEPSDFRVVGDRLYAVMYQGMTQSLGYFSLSKPGFAKTVMAPKKGSNISFSVVSGDGGTERLFVERRHLTEPTEFHLVQPDDTSQLVHTVPLSPSVLASDLSFKVYPARPDALLSPMVIVGRKATLLGDVCEGGLALVEVYGGPAIPMRPRNPLGLVKSLFDRNGVHITVHLPGGGGFGPEWTGLGAYGNSGNQARSLRQTLRVLQNNGCNQITLTGFSHGGVVSINTAVRFPDLVDSVVIGGTPLDLKQEYRAGNAAIAAFLPKEDGDSLTYSRQSDGSIQDSLLEDVSPASVISAAPDLSGLSVTIMVGSRDNRAISFAAPDVLRELNAKGAQVEVIERQDVGHTRFANRTQWAEYYAILGSALETSIASP